MVCYEDFRRDGLNDYEVIKAAHDYANMHLEPVMAENGRIYSIDLVPEPISIQTSVDFNNATFIIDDSKLELSQIGPIFIVGQPNRNGRIIDYKTAIRSTDTNIGLQFDSPQLLEIEDLSRRNFIRFGDNGHAGAPAKELVVVDKNGTIQVSLNEDF